MRPDTSMSTWVPAVHAGTTSSYNDYVTHTNLMVIAVHPTKFSKEHTKSTKGSEIYLLLNFVSFVVKSLFLLVATLPP
jgi:hypothetical protein